MKALTLIQPWATLVAIGAKHFETRSWSTRYRGRLAITAAAGFPVKYRWLCDEEWFQAALIEEGYAGPAKLPRGAVLCTCELVAVHSTEMIRDQLTVQERAFGDYSDGRFAWELREVRILPEPIPCKGNRQLWEWDGGPSPRYSPGDMELAAEQFGAACGHGALAAALGCPVRLAVPLFERPGWINIPMMTAAIVAAGWTYRKVRTIPRSGTGVAMVQFLGPWMKDGVPPAARCKYRHWIAVADGVLHWDANWPEWAGARVWSLRAPELYPERCTGHEIAGILAVEERTRGQGDAETRGKAVRA